MALELKDIAVEKKALTTDESMSEAFYAEHQQLADELGFRRQVSTAKANLQQLRRPTVLTPPLTSSEVVIWSKFLPTSYRGEDLTDYSFDLIPIHVLQELREWKQSGAFEEFEIRTEEKLNDPALFGIRDGQYWLLARWGAADVSLISFDEIKNRLRTALLKSKRNGRTAFFALLAIFVVGVIGAGFTSYAVISTILSVATFFWGFAAWGHWRDETPIRQALD
jgi:hypothetical protein